MTRGHDLDGRVVIVTGASRGIGLEVARRVAEHGARVGLLGRDAESVRAAAERVRGTTATACADVTDAGALARSIAQLQRVLGPVDVLVNNAGHGWWGAVLHTPVEEFRRALEVNFLGAVHATAAVLPDMLQRGRGRIVNVASIAGRIGAPFEAAYSASKFALVGYSEALAVELAGTGVTVSLVDPGPTETEFFTRRGHPYTLSRPRPVPAGRVADAVARAAARGTAQVTVPRWLRAAQVVKVIAPAVYRSGTRRVFAGPRAELRRRISTANVAMEHGGAMGEHIGHGADGHD